VELTLVGAAHQQGELLSGEALVIPWAKNGKKIPS